MRPTRPLLALLLLSATISGCQCDDGLNRIDDPQDPPLEPGLPVSESPEMEDREPPADPVWTLAFLEDDPLTVHFGDVTTLHVLVTDERGDPVGNAPVRLELVGTVVSLGALDVVTGPEGIAEVAAEAGLLIGDATVLATAPFVELPAALVIKVREDPDAILEIHTTTTARIGLLQSELVVYVVDEASQESCATLSAELPATFVEALSSLPTISHFNVAAFGRRAVVLGAGYGPTGDLVATGCAEATELVGGEVNLVDLVLEQLPSTVDGEYDVLMSMGLGGLLPEPYESTIDLVTGVLADPAGYAVYRALAEMDAETGTSFVHWEVGGSGEVLASFDDVRDNPGDFPTWTLARDLLSDELEGTLGQTYTDITTVGGDLRDIVTDFEVGARFEIVTEQDDASKLGVEERWNALVFEWSWGCEEGDLACVRRPVDLDNTDYAPVTSSYAAAWEHQPSGAESERFYVRTFPHRLALRYGAIILIALDELLYPALGAEDLSGFLVNLIDCQSVGESIADALGGIPLLYESFCVAGMTAAASQIEDQLLSLEVGEGDPDLAPDASEGVAGDSWMWLVDADHDLFTEDVPHLEYDVAWVDPANPGLSQEIAAPITGQGRLTASQCTEDAQCGLGEACQPVPSYLLVADVELDCRRAVGPLLGEDLCLADGECASGLCQQGRCYSACQDDSACGLGSCSNSGALVDLDGLMVGLGEVWAPSCVMD